MNVITETLVSALEEMEGLEEISVWNLAQVRRYDLSVFDPADRERIHQLLDMLREDTSEHREILSKIIARLKRGQKDHSISQRNLKGF